MPSLSSFQSKVSNLQHTIGAQAHHAVAKASKVPGKIGNALSRKLFRDAHRQTDVLQAAAFMGEDPAAINFPRPSKALAFRKKALETRDAVFQKLSAAGRRHRDLDDVEQPSLDDVGVSSSEDFVLPSIDHIDPDL